MDQFSIGEIAIMFDPGTKYHLEEVSITGKLESRNWISIIDNTNKEGLCYLVANNNFGERFCIRPEYLRKKKPPEEEDRYTGNDVISWDDERSVWQPTEVKEKVCYKPGTVYPKEYFTDE